MKNKSLLSIVVNIMPYSNYKKLVLLLEKVKSWKNFFDEEQVKVKYQDPLKNQF